MTIALPIVLLVVLLFFGMPVAFSLAISGCVGLWLVDGFGSIINILSTSPYRTASFILTTIPMFILMAEFTSSGGLARELFNLANRWLGHLPGGVAISTVLASAGFGAMSGSSTASAATMSRIAIPEMLRFGYRRDVAAGVVTVSGTLAIMIPPSIPLVVYGITTETSIGKLLIAGIIPGLMTAAVYCIGIIVWTRMIPGAMKPVSPFSWKDRIESLKSLWPFLVLVLVVIGGMYSGLATASEVAALGALGALLICLFMRRIDLKGVIAAIGRTVITTTMIFTIIIGAMIFGYFLTMTQTTQNLVNYVGGLGVPNWLIMGILVVVYLILGCFMDQLAILLLTLPLTFPLVTSLGYDGIWFGIVVTKLAEIGLVTPPLGMNAYVVAATAKIPLDEVFKGIGVMLLFEFVTLALILNFPKLSLFLPSLMR